VLFADGAGAFILQASETTGGVLSCVMRSDGSGADLLTLPAGGSRLPASKETVENNLHTIRMNGREVFRFATRAMASATRESLSLAGLTIEDIDLVIPHQANQRIIESAARSLKLPMERFMMNLERYGNTSTASIPIALCEAVEQDRLKDGDNVVLVGFGAGLTWGALTLKWVEAGRVAAPIPGWRRSFSNVFANLRSWLRRIRRKLEGLIWGTSTRP